MNGLPVTISLSLPFPNTVAEDDGKPNGKQIGDLFASRKEITSYPYAITLETQKLIALH